MDLGNPLRSLLGRNAADALRVINRVDAPLVGSSIARLAGLPGSSGARALQALEEIGLVDAEQVGRSRRYTANRDHLLWPAVERALEALSALEQLIVERANAEADVSLLLYGSVARDDADAASDVDLLLVHDDGAEPSRIDRLVDDLQQITVRASGNSAQIYVISRGDLRRAVDDAEPIVASLRRDARLLSGDPIDLEARA